MKKSLWIVMVLVGVRALYADVDLKELYDAVKLARQDTVHTNGMQTVLEAAKLTEGEDEVISRCMAFYAARLALAGDARRYRQAATALRNRYPDSKADRQLHSGDPIQSDNGKESVNRPRATILWGNVGKELEALLGDTLACDEAIANAEKGSSLEEKVKILQSCYDDARRAIPARIETVKKMLMDAKQQLDQQKREELDKHRRSINTLQSVLPLKLRVAKIKEYIAEHADSPYLHDAETLLESAQEQYVVERRKSTLIRVAIGAVSVMVLVWMITFIKVNWFQTKVKSVYKPMIVPAEDDTPFNPYAEDMEIKPKPQAKTEDSERDGNGV
ncbi:MAG: hypothetical protein J6334_02600 [Kiritimatiellae bacterium]|nr:hypothetical protein [Kiritimatiellia bacterium]